MRRHIYQDKLWHILTKDNYRYIDQTTRSANSSLQTPLTAHNNQLIQEWKKT